MVDRPAQSIHVTEGNRSIAHLRQLLRRELIMPAFADDLRPLFIDAHIIHNQDNSGDESDARKADLEGVPEDVPRRIPLAVEVRRERAAEVARADLDRHAGASLVVAGQVVGEPGDVARERGVDSRRGDEDACVHDAWVACGDTPEIGEETSWLVL